MFVAIYIGVKHGIPRLFSYANGAENILYIFYQENLNKKLMFFGVPKSARATRLFVIFL